jgi:AcrR family transcriptional regulator
VVRHAKDELLAAAVQVAREEGLRQLSFGRVAKLAGTNDRTVVYYFPSKEQLVSAVLLAVSRDLEARLSAVGEQRRRGHVDLLEVAWPVLAHPDADAVFALFFEASGLAAAGTAPYDAIVPALVSAWLDWAEARLSGTGTVRRAEAEAAVAVLDGLLLFRQLMGPVAAGRAAEQVFRSRER